MKQSTNLSSDPELNSGLSTLHVTPLHYGTLRCSSVQIPPVPFFHLRNIYTFKSEFDVTDQNRKMDKRTFNQISSIHVKTPNTQIRTFSLCRFSTCTWGTFWSFIISTFRVAWFGTKIKSQFPCSEGIIMILVDFNWNEPEMAGQFLFSVRTET